MSTVELPGPRSLPPLRRVCHHPHRPRACTRIAGAQRRFFDARGQAVADKHNRLLLASRLSRCCAPSPECEGAGGVGGVGNAGGLNDNAVDLLRILKNLEDALNEVAAAAERRAPRRTRTWRRRTVRSPSASLPEGAADAAVLQLHQFLFLLQQLGLPYLQTQERAARARIGSAGSCGRQETARRRNAPARRRC